MQNNLSFIAKEGWKVLGYSIAIFIFFVLLHLNFLSYIAFAFILFFAFVYRNPERASSVDDANGVVSPVDGKILSIEELHNDNEYTYKITIDSSYSDVSALRSPISAVVEDFEHIHGTKLGYGDKLYNALNENLTFTLVSPNGMKMKLKHTLKESFDDVSIYIKKDDSLKISARYGFMLSGITTIYLPKTFHINVNVGSKLFASSSLLGSFKQ